MILNCHSYLHVKIRKLCSQLEVLTKMRLKTDICNEFVELRFTNEYGYLVINWRRNAVFTLSHKLTEVELAICDEIMIYLNWLEAKTTSEEREGAILYGDYTKR